MLLDIRNYIKKQGGIVSLEALVLHFAIEPDALRAMIKHWVARGKIRVLPAKICSGCNQCAPEKLEKYQWIEKL